MPKSANQKQKLLVLGRLLFEQTDEEHGLTMRQIIDHLAANGIAADRKTLYQDLEELRRFGMDIVSDRVGRDTCYSLVSRDFELPELKLLVDSVQAAKFITDRKSRELIRKLEGLVSVHQARQLHRQVIIAGRVKTMNESIYYNIDKLHTAINADARIRFQYSQWTVNKEMALRRGGRVYEVSPWFLTWDDGNYYLVAYDALDARIKHYRVDKMQRIRVADLPREGREAAGAVDLTRYARSVFGMFGGETTWVTLEGEEAMVGVVIDRFGKDIAVVPVEGGRFEAKVEVAVSSQFFGWIMGLGDGVRIAGPAPVVRRMRDEARRLAQRHE